MKKIEFALACLMLHSSLACIALHLITLVKHKQTWARAKAGIIREFTVHKFRLY
ncbi:MAG: hypothetical protein KBC33_01015 [Candidatus Pacebacteria bacterium]|nr:hypothetical protein [Candidatus Paceibacterota bacterium]